MDPPKETKSSSSFSDSGSDNINCCITLDWAYFLESLSAVSDFNTYAHLEPYIIRVGSGEDRFEVYASTQIQGRKARRVMTNVDPQ